MSELTAGQLAAQLRAEAREVVLRDAREAYVELEHALVLLKACARLTLAEQLEVTNLAVRLRRALGITGPFMFAAGVVPHLKPGA